MAFCPKVGAKSGPAGRCGWALCATKTPGEARHTGKPGTGGRRDAVVLPPVPGLIMFWNDRGLRFARPRLDSCAASRLPSGGVPQIKIAPVRCGNGVPAIVPPASHRCNGETPSPPQLAWSLRTKHVSIVWKNRRNMFPLSGKKAKHTSIQWKTDSTMPTKSTKPTISDAVDGRRFSASTFQLVFPLRLCGFA